ncbi:MAG: hypothetical protein LBN94_00750, partial [Puniceicoccales bacterium]|nr:hypothetical protein [Puniceicoccales bacterium]
MMKYFGTDGMRGTFGVAPINPFYFNVLAQALWYFYGGLKRVIMGRDTRISGEAIRQFLIDGFPQSVEILDGGILTSPLLSRSVEHTKSDLGLMITASHNPAADNGVKIFDRAGMKLPQRDEEGIETVMDEIGKEVRNRGHRIVGYEVSASYTMGDEIFQKFDKVVIDCANGAAIEFAKKAYRFPEVEWLGVTPDGSNINAHCGSEYPSSLIEKVKDRGAHLGIAHDGDGDRLLLCDGKGKIIPGEAILGIIAIYLGCIGRLSNRKIVTTLMSNQGLERTLKTYDIGVDYV